MPAPEPAPNASPKGLSPVSLIELCAQVLCPDHFFLAPRLEVQSEFKPAEEDQWEVFQGRLLDRPFTRQRRTFAAWNLFLVDDGVRSGEPLLSLKLDDQAGELHVVRGVESYVHEGYDAGGGVFQTRARRRWVRELTGTIRLREFATGDALHDELACRLFRAVVGTSRLPLHSVEAPLPAFSVGRLFYRFRRDAPAGAPPLRTAAEFASAAGPHWTPLEWAKLLEIYLLAASTEDPSGEHFAARWAALGRTGDDLVRLLRTLFNEVSLSPWTGLVDRALAFVAARERHGTLREDQVTDFLAHLLRQTGRHLTAYDLVIFHHRGANYPDALLLDAVLKAYLARVDRRPSVFADEPGDDPAVRTCKRMRRRALRQGWLLRRRYEGHAVPDAPTSPGEHARVFPPEFPRVPEEQLLQPAKRKKLLFADDPLPRHFGPHAEAVLRQAVADLRHDAELRELGTALYVDRPFGDAKAPAEPDATPLLASEAFSPSIATGRLGALARDGLLSEGERSALSARARQADFSTGLPLDAIGMPPRPGTVALTDARMAAGDFVFRRTVPGAVDSLLETFDFGPLATQADLNWLLGDRPVLVARTPAGRIGVYDEFLRQRLELAIAPGGYTSRGGVEYPAGGLVVVRAWSERASQMTGHSFGAEQSRILPR